MRLNYFIEKYETFLEILLQAVYLSVDPYMRIFPTEEGSIMKGEQLSE